MAGLWKTKYFFFFFCGMCRISLKELCRIPNKNCLNVLILRKMLHNRLQNGYRLVYFIDVNDKDL